MKLTDWFPPNIKPVRVGVYRVRTGFFKHWNGKIWGRPCSNVDQAIKRKESPASLQDNSWRGLSEEPK